MSSLFFGYATATGIFLYTEASVAYKLLVSMSVCKVPFRVPANSENEKEFKME